MRSRQRTSEPIVRNTWGRRGETRLPLRNNKKKSLSILLGIFSGVLLVAAFAVYLSIYHEGDNAQKSAQNLLSQYNAAVSASPSASTPLSSAPAAPTSAPVTVTSLPPGDEYTQPAAPDVDPRDALVSLPGYDVIGKLRIEKIGVELPVISKVTTKALKASICWYCGALPGEKGNMIITGHNYANGAHFGKLHSLAKGDEVIFDAPGGMAYHYEVYEMMTVTPDNLDALNKYEGEYALTLVTCASSGNRRLIVRCKYISGS